MKTIILVLLIHGKVEQLFVGMARPEWVKAIERLAKVKHIGTTENELYFFGGVS